MKWTWSIQKTPLSATRDAAVDPVSHSAGKPCVSMAPTSWLLKWNIWIKLHYFHSSSQYDDVQRMNETVPVRTQRMSEQRWWWWWPISLRYGTGTVPVSCEAYRTGTLKTDRLVPFLLLLLLCVAVLRSPCTVSYSTYSTYCMLRNKTSPVCHDAGPSNGDKSSSAETPCPRHYKKS